MGYGFCGTGPKVPEYAEANLRGFRIVNHEYQSIFSFLLCRFGTYLSGKLK